MKNKTPNDNIDGINIKEDGTIEAIDIKVPDKFNILDAEGEAPYPVSKDLKEAFPSALSVLIGTCQMELIMEAGDIANNVKIKKGMRRAYSKHIRNTTDTLARMIAIHFVPYWKPEERETMLHMLEYYRSDLTTRFIFNFKESGYEQQAKQDLAINLGFMIYFITAMFQFILEGKGLSYTAVTEKVFNLKGSQQKEFLEKQIAIS